MLNCTVVRCSACSLNEANGDEANGDEEANGDARRRTGTQLDFLWGTPLWADRLLQTLWRLDHVGQTGHEAAYELL